MDFVQCEGSRGVLQVLNPPYLIIQTWLRVVGLRMVSVNQLPTFLSKHVPRQAPELHFNKVRTSQHLFRFCYVMQHTRCWKGAGPYYFYSLAMILYFKALEDVSTFASCLFIPKLPLIVPKSTVKSANKGPWNHGFCSMCGLQRCSKDPSPSWFHYVHLVEGFSLRMVLLDQFPDFSYRNMSPSRH